MDGSDSEFVRRLQIKCWSGLQLSEGLSDAGESAFLKINLYLFIYLFLAALGLLCCVRAFSSCGEGYPWLWRAGFSLQWLLLLWSTGSRLAGSRARAQ